MMVVMALVAGLVVGAGAVAAIYHRELGRMARFLDERPSGSNTRLTVAVPGRAARRLATAVNAQLDAIQTERIRALGEAQEFQRGLSALAHDVRTPLMGAQGHIQLALDDIGTEPGARSCDRHLRIALGRLGDVRALLDQLFAYARANDPDRTFEIEPVAAHALVAETLVAHYPQFEARGWRPHVDFEDERFTLEADRAALGRIVDNLVVNALRHGTTTLTVRQRGGAVTFVNGLNARTAARLDPDRLFDRFYQADDARGTHGSGLGLAVARSLACAMRLDLSAALIDDATGPALAVTLASGAPAASGDAARP